MSTVCLVESPSNLFAHLVLLVDSKGFTERNGITDMDDEDINEQLDDQMPVNVMLAESKNGRNANLNQSNGGFDLGSESGGDDDNIVGEDGDEDLIISAVG